MGEEPVSPALFRFADIADPEIVEAVDPRAGLLVRSLSAHFVDTDSDSDADDTAPGVSGARQARQPSWVTHKGDDGAAPADAGLSRSDSVDRALASLRAQLRPFYDEVRGDLRRSGASLSASSSAVSLSQDCFQ